MNIERFNFKIKISNRPIMISYNKYNYMIYVMFYVFITFVCPQNVFSVIKCN